MNLNSDQRIVGPKFGLSRMLRKHKENSEEKVKRGRNNPIKAT